MEEKKFWKSKEGGLTIAFIVIMAAFFLVLYGLSTASDLICLVSFTVMVLAMLYSPVNTFIISKRDH